VVVGSFSVATGFAQAAKPSDLMRANQTDKNPPITNESLPAGARLYIAPMPNGFETYVAAGLEKKKVPVVLVIDPPKSVRST
jgi:RNA:NAD 2'-phosphotransferase (TPT1/KptA family)